MNATQNIEQLLPLRPAVFGILMVLRAEPLHGYGIMKRANRHVGHQALLGPGTLYRTLKELRDAGFLQHTAAPAPGADARRQYYGLTAAGNELVAAEEARLRALLTADADASLAAER